MRDQRDGLRSWMGDHAKQTPPLLPGDTDPAWAELDPNEPACGSRHPSGVFCTLDRLHVGWHVAHRTEGVVSAVWVIDDTGGMHTAFTDPRT